MVPRKLWGEGDVRSATGSTCSLPHHLQPIYQLGEDNLTFVDILLDDRLVTNEIVGPRLLSSSPWRIRRISPTLLPDDSGHSKPHSPFPRLTLNRYGGGFGVGSMV